MAEHCNLQADRVHFLKLFLEERVPHPFIAYDWKQHRVRVYMVNYVSRIELLSSPLRQKSRSRWVQREKVEMLMEIHAALQQEGMLGRYDWTAPLKLTGSSKTSVPGAEQYVWRQRDRRTLELSG